MLPPSVLAHGLNALLLVAAFVLAFVGYSYRTVVLVLMFSIAVGVHGISHALLEKHYNFFPWRLFSTT